MPDKLLELDRLLHDMSDDEIAKTWARCMRMLRVRDLVRTANTPMGDYAERICCDRFKLERKGLPRSRSMQSMRKVFGIKSREDDSHRRTAADN